MSHVFQHFKHEEWQHTIIRFVRLGDGGKKEFLPIEEITPKIEKLKKGWEKVLGPQKTNYAILIWHGYGGGETEEKDYSKIPHLHILWKYYKGTAIKALLSEFIERYSLEHKGFRVSNFHGLQKYLLQGKGRTLLCETGIRPKTEVYTRDELIRGSEEALICEDNLWKECDEAIKSTRKRNRGTSEGAPGASPAHKIPEITMMQKLEDLFIKYRIKDENNLQMMVTPEDREWIDRASITNKEWHKIFMQARTNACMRVKKMYWVDIMKTLPDDPGEYSVKTMSINKSVRVLYQLLSIQGYGADERLRFIKNVKAVMDNSFLRQKRNTLYLIGAVSSGKSLITKSLVTSSIFAFVTGEYNARSSDFHWEDMVWARIASIEEPQIEAGKIDKFKVLFEGGSFDTNVKFKVKSKVEGVPVIVSSNSEVWRYAPEAKAAFDERWYRWEFNTSIQDKVNICGALHPKAWLRLLEHYGLDTEPDVGSDSDSEFDFDVFGGAAPPKKPKQTEDDEYLDDIMRQFDGGDVPRGRSVSRESTPEVVEVVRPAPPLPVYSPDGLIEAFNESRFICQCGHIWDSGEEQCICVNDSAQRISIYSFVDIQLTSKIVGPGKSVSFGKYECTTIDPTDMNNLGGLMETWALIAPMCEDDEAKLFNPLYFIVNCSDLHD